MTKRTTRCGKGMAIPAPSSARLAPPPPRCGSWRKLRSAARASGWRKIQRLSHKRHAEDGAYEFYRSLSFVAETEGFRRYIEAFGGPPPHGRHFAPRVGRPTYSWSTQSPSRTSIATTPGVNVGDPLL